MVTEVIWTQKQRILDFINQHGDSFARYKLPHPTIDKITKALGKLENNCFRNCLLLAIACEDYLEYCEGFAIIEDRYYPHAWLFPKELHGEKNQYWILDPTYPWLLENYNDGKPLDKINYIGVRLKPKQTHEELLKLGGNHSILRYFNNCNLKELLS